MPAPVNQETPMRFWMPLFVLSLLLVPASTAGAHCEVPCGIYGDKARFTAMQEDQATIAKAMTEIAALAAKTDALSANQLTRWVMAKEDHATKVQHTIAQYFMSQRIKPDAEGYVGLLTKAHAVMLAAMKCKQSVAEADAAALHKAIHTFEAAYAPK